MRLLANSCRTLSLFVALCLPCFLATPCTAKPDDKPTQFNNGQNGTPNLPEAVCRFIDLTHMRGAAIGIQGQTAKNLSLTLTNDGKLDEAIQPYQAALQRYTAALSDPTHAGLAAAQEQLTVAKDRFQAELNRLSLAPENAPVIYDFPNSSFYVGSEVRAGAGKTDYILPELTYCDNRFGIELGSESFLELGEGNSDIFNGLGVSLKGEFTDTARAFPRRVSRLQAALSAFDTARRSDIQTLRKIIEIINASNDLDVIKLNADKLTAIADRYKDINKSSTTPRLQALFSLDIQASGGTLPPRLFPAPVQDSEQLTGIKALAKQTEDIRKDYVRLTKRAIVAGFVGNRLYNRGGGSLLDGGITASQLFPLRQGDVPAGVTALAVVQGFDDRLQDSRRQGAERLGLAAIWQDRTPSYDETTRRLASPWNVKFGLEYTTPLLGQHETYAEFVQYRALPSYVDIIVAAGKDGQRKNYVDVSIGKSFAF